MHFVIGSGLFIFLIWLMVVSPGFRLTAFIILGVAAVAIFVAIKNSDERTTRYAAEQANLEQARQVDERRRRETIALDDLAFSEVRLFKKPYDWELTGIVKNNANASLTNFSLTVVFQDCSQECVVIGQETPSISLDVPSKQARQFVKSLDFKNMPQAKTPKWFYKLTSTRSQ